MSFEKRRKQKLKRVMNDLFYIIAIIIIIIFFYSKWNKDYLNKQIDEIK